MGDPRKQYDEAMAAAAAIKAKVREFGFDPNMLAGGSAVQLGSGLQQAFGARLGDNVLTIPFDDIPHMVAANAAAAPTHKMQLMIGELEGDSSHLVVIFCGRYHLYQGIPVEACTFYVRVVKALDIDVLGITCAAGILDDEHIDRGDIVAIDDIFNFSGTSATRGETHEMWGDPFAPMTTLLPGWIVAEAKRIATQELGWDKLHSCTYLQDRGELRGYQTAFASKLYRSWGAGLVGKSTTVELEVVDDVAITKSFALALATNFAGGLRPDLQPEVTNDHVLDEGVRHAEKFGALLCRLLQSLHDG